MTIALLLGVLALFDSLLAGFRGAAGRDGRIDKRSYFRRAIGRAALLAVIVVGANVAVTAALVATAAEPDATWTEIVHAGTTCVWVFGTFATVTLAALAFWLSPVAEYQLLASIIVLGPLTLARPLVIAGGLAVAAAQSAEPRVWIAATIAGVTMLAFEPLVGSLHSTRWRELV